MNVKQSGQLIKSSQNEFFQLIYPERIVLGWADILTGFAISGVLRSNEIELTFIRAYLLLIATVMSGGGAILAHGFSIARNVTRHLEIGKPKQSNFKNSIATGIILSCLTLLVALMASPWTAFLAVAISLGAFGHSFLTANHPIYGLLSLALYRASCILLGISIIPHALQQHWYIVLIPIIYLAIAVIYAQKKVEESTGRSELPIILGILVVFESLFQMYFVPGYDIFKALLFAIILARQILPPYFKSLYEPTPEIITFSTNAFWTGIFLLDATIAAGFSNWFYALLVLSMLPIARRASRLTSNLETNTHIA